MALLCRKKPKFSIDELKVADNEILENRFALEHPNVNAGNVYKEYCRFIELKVAMGDYDAVKLSPSPLVDSMWQLHILDTRRYVEMCSKLPSFIHYDPDGCMDKWYEITLVAYRARFSEDAPSAVWPPQLHQKELMIDCEEASTNFSGSIVTNDCDRNSTTNFLCID